MGGSNNMLEKNKEEKIIGWHEEHFRYNHINDIGDKEDNCEKKSTDNVSLLLRSGIWCYRSILHQHIDNTDDDMEDCDQKWSNNDGKDDQEDDWKHEEILPDILSDCARVTEF